MLEAEADRLVVAAGQAAVRLLVVQVPGKKPMSAAEFLRAGIGCGREMCL